MSEWKDRVPRRTKAPEQVVLERLRTHLIAHYGQEPDFRWMKYLQVHFMPAEDGFPAETGIAISTNTNRYLRPSITGDDVVKQTQQLIEILRADFLKGTPLEEPRTWHGSGTALGIQYGGECQVLSLTPRQLYKIGETLDLLERGGPAPLREAVATPSR